MVNGRSTPPRSSASPCHISESVGRLDISFNESENTNLFVEELLHKSEPQHVSLTSEPNTREIHLLTARRRLSLGGSCDDDAAKKRAMSRSCLIPPVFPGPLDRANHPNQYNAVRELTPQDQAKEWWKMLYGDDKTHCHTLGTIPRSARAKAGNNTPNSVATSIRAEISATPLRNSGRCVKFGSASAAEFEKDDPPQGSLTPMPPTKAAERFPTDFKEPDPETADLIAMTKENSATLAEWEFFDDGEDDNDASDDILSPIENRRSRRESGRFKPFCETESYETSDQEVVSMDTTETRETLTEVDVGKTCEMNSTQDHETEHSTKGEDLLVELSSTATQLFTNLAVSFKAEVRSYAECQTKFSNTLERELLACRDSSCVAVLEKCLYVTLRSISEPTVSILQKKRIEYQLKSNPDLHATSIARANFKFQSAFIDFLECLDLEELRTRIKVQTEQVNAAIFCLEKVYKRNLLGAIAEEEESIKSLEKGLLAAQASKECARRRILDVQLLRRSRIPLTYFVMNFIAPFELVDSSSNKITLEFPTSFKKCRLQLAVGIKEESFAFKQMGCIDDESLADQSFADQQTLAVMSRAFLSATCSELESDILFDSLPVTVLRVAQVLQRVDDFLGRLTSLVASCDDFSVVQNGSKLSVTLHLPVMTKAEIVYNLSGPLLLDPDSLRPEVSVHRNGELSTEVFPPLSQFLEVGYS